MVEQHLVILLVKLGHTAIRDWRRTKLAGTFAKAQEAIRNYLDHINIYPDGSGYYLRQKLAKIQGLSMNQIILGAGCPRI